MNFDQLNNMIPHVTGGKSKILKMNPYNAITLRMPGRHANQTSPPGGDFVVCVDDEGMDWTEHQFTHTDIFNDLQIKSSTDFEETRFLLRLYLGVVASGDDPEKVSVADEHNMAGMHWKTFLYAVQCLAVAEHRRYAQHEAKFGGRYLPLRFGAGIAEGLWSASQAADRQRRGRLGVEWLEKDYGVPSITQQFIESMTEWREQ